ncbi:MAG: hypothetical protein JOZ60_02280 [Verrucomicrobia bacterium]|nr:hypothetical protein [Verrucomicrobiota bacterium]
MSYSPRLETALKFILQDPSIPGSAERPTSRFITAARFLKKNAPHLFEIRKMGAESGNPMDRWLWDLLG